MVAEGVIVGLVIGGAVVVLIVLVATIHYMGKRKKRRRREEEVAKARVALVLGSARSGASRPTRVIQGKKPGTGDNFSNRHNIMLTQKGGTGTFSVAGPFPAVTASFPAVQQSTSPPTGVSHGRNTGNHYSNRHNTMPPHPPPNAGSTPYSLVTGQSLATTFPGTHITSMPPVPQQHQTYQDQMQALQFSSHPRPNYVTTAYSTEPATSSPPVSYTGSSGAPQAAWEPTPFVPPARPASSTRLPSPSAGAGAAGRSPDTSTATALSSTTDTAALQTNATRDPQDRGTPSPSSPPPSVPRNTRPGQEAGPASSPQALLVRSQNPQYVDDYHLH